MLNLAEYRKSATSLADYLPWACLIAPGVVLNKDGSLQRTFRYRGPDLDSATDAELVAVSARLNTILKRFGSGWALFFEAAREPAQAYPKSAFADPVSWLVDEERRAQFETHGAHFENRFFLTLLYLPPPDLHDRAGQAFFKRPQAQTPTHDVTSHLAHFLTETDRTLELLRAILPEADPLSDGETLSFLHTTISTKPHAVARPEIPAHLDAYLCDTPLQGGIAPKLGDRHLRVLTVLGFPNTTQPGVFDALNDLGFAYRWTTRWIALDKTQAEKQLNKLRRQWFAKRKSLTAILREVIFNRETALVDNDADNKAIDADAALQELGADDVAFGYLTTTLVVTDAHEAAADEKLLSLERILNGRGFATIRETLNAVEAWLGSLPGNPYANVRQPIVHTLNLVHMMPVSAVWAGPQSNAHLNAPPLMVTETRGTTPFRLDLHVGDVGHTCVIGPTGAGKSVLLATLALQFRRYANAQVVVFDKGNSARAALLAMGGQSFALAVDEGLAFQPLADIDAPAGIAFALEWVLGLLTNEGVKITPEVKDTVWSALQSLATAPKEERTLTGLAVLIQSNALAQALTPYTLDGAYGRLLDAADDALPDTDVLHFEMEALIEAKAVLLPLLTYLFHRLEARFDGRPSLLILDEAWAFLDDPNFAARIRAWLKTLRKKNVAVVFATQSLADIESTAIAPALIESCLTRIFLPNARALEPQTAAIYSRFGLNRRQIEILSQATAKRDYYLQSPRGNRLFQLGLGRVALCLTAAGTPQDQILIDRLVAEAAPEEFVARFLAAKGLDWAAELIVPAPQAPPAPPPLPEATTTAAQPKPKPSRPTNNTNGLKQRLAMTTALTPLPAIDTSVPHRFSPYTAARKASKGDSA